MKLTYEEVESIRFVVNDIDRQIKELREHMERLAKFGNHSFFQQLPARYQDYAKLAYKREGMVDILLRLNLMKEIRCEDSALEQIARAGT